MNKESLNPSVSTKENPSAFNWSFPTTHPDIWSCHSASAQTIKATHPEFAEYLRNWHDDQNIVIGSEAGFIGTCSLHARTADLAIVCYKYVLSDQRKFGVATELSRMIREYARYLGFSELKGFIPGIWKASEVGLILQNPDHYRHSTNSDGGYDSLRAVLRAYDTDIFDCDYYMREFSENYWGLAYTIKI